LGSFVIVYNELENDTMGRLELDFGGIDCEFGGLSPLATPNAVDLGGSAHCC